MRNFPTCLLVFLLLLGLPGHAQKITLSGYVTDGETREVLIGANIYESTLQQGVTSNQYGFYSLTLSAQDTLNVIISFVGYRPEVKKVFSTVNLRLDLSLFSSNQLEAVEINSARNDDNVNKTQMSVIDVPMKEIKNLPMLMGERDILKVIQYLPGVQQAQEGTTGFFVRGGNLDQNLVQLDEAVVYNPNHLFGLLSTFNVNAVNNVQLTKGGFPASYGGRLSSILDITMKDGNKEKVQTEGGVGLISSNLTVQGPVIRNKASFIISGRRSYVDLIQKAFIPNSTTLYSFYDVNAKLNFELGKNDKVFLSAFMGRDNGSYTGPNSLNYGIGFGNSTATLRWNHLFGNNLFANTSFIVNDYHLGLSTTQGNYYSLFFTGIKDINAKTDFSWNINPQHVIRYGGSYFFHTLFPATHSSEIPLSGNKVRIEPSSIPRKYSEEIAAYFHHDWDLSKKFGLSYGLRVPHFIAGDAAYTEFEPRVTTKSNITTTSSVKASYTLMHQFLHAVPYSTASLPTDIWITSSKAVEPQRSRQYSIGFFKNLKDNLFEASLEVYHKQMRNQVLFKQGTQLQIQSDIEQTLTFGKGASYGAEFFFRKNTGRLTGWLSYTLSKTTQTFASLNFGKPFPFTYHTNTHSN